MSSNTFGIHWFSPEFLLRYEIRNFDEADHCLTVKDHALLLSLVSRFTDRDFDTRDPGDSAPIVAIRAKEWGPYANGIALKAAVANLRISCGFARTAHMQASLSRLTMAGMKGGELVFDGFSGIGDGKGELSYALTPSMTRAHPLNSGSKQSCMVDCSAMASFSTVNSVGLALRALAWLTTSCRATLGRIPHEWRGKDLFLEIPVHRVGDVMALNEVEPGQLTRLFPKSSPT